MLGDDIAGEQRALLHGGPRAERLADRNDVVVDRLGQPDHGQLIAVAAEVGREIGRGAVGVVAADGVEDVDTVAPQLLGRDGQRVLARLDEPSLDAVVDVGELDPAVADGTAAERVKPMGVRPHLVGHLGGFAGKQAGIAVAVGDDPSVRCDLGVALDQAADGGGQAGGKAARGEHGNCDGHGLPISGLVGFVHLMREQVRAHSDGARRDGGFEQENGKCQANAQHRGDEQPGDLGSQSAFEPGLRQTTGRRPGRSGSPR